MSDWIDGPPTEPGWYWLAWHPRGSLAQGKREVGCDYLTPNGWFRQGGGPPVQMAHRVVAHLPILDPPDYPLLDMSTSPVGVAP